MVERVFRYVMADHPEIFYADGYEVTTYRLGTELHRITEPGRWNQTKFFRAGHSWKRLQRSGWKGCRTGRTILKRRNIFMMR